MTRTPGPQLLQHTPRRIYVLVVALSLPFGIALVLSPLYGTLLIVGSLLALICCFVPRWEILLLALFLVLQDPLRVMAGGYTPLEMQVRRADEILILLIGMGALFIPAVRSCYRRHGLALAVAGCYVGVVGSSLIQQTAFIPAATDFALFSKPFLLLAIGMSLKVPERIERSVSKLLVVLVAVLSFGILFLVFPGLQRIYLASHEVAAELRLGFAVAQGFFINPGVYSWFAAASFCMCTAAYLAYARHKYLLYSLASAVFVLLSWRRKSILAVLVVVLVAVLVANRRRAKARAFLLLSIVTVVVVAGLAPFFGAIVSDTIAEYGSADPYSTARVALHYTSVVIARDHFPFGAGLASFASHSSRLYYSEVYETYGLSTVYGLSPRSPKFVTDTFWPMVLGQGGVISLVSYLVFLSILGVTALRVTLSNPSSKTTLLLCLASLFLLTGAMVESVASHVFGSSLQAALVLVPTGIMWRRVVDSGNDVVATGARSR